jgi:hypothetical protein
VGPRRESRQPCVRFSCNPVGRRRDDGGLSENRITGISCVDYGPDRTVFCASFEVGRTGSQSNCTFYTLKQKERRNLKEQSNFPLEW